MTSTSATSLPATPDGDVAIDPLEGMPYWAINAGSSSKIQRKSLGGGPVEDIFALGGYMTGIALDPVSRHVYVATPGIATRIWRYDIDDPGSPVPFVLFSETGCLCSPQGLALDPGGGFLYWADQNNGKIARKAVDLATPIEDVITGISQPAALALDTANDRVYFSQTAPNRVSYALLSSPTPIVDLVDPAAEGLFAGSLERDPTAGTLGDLFVAVSGESEILRCGLDAGCPAPLAVLASGMLNGRGLALLPVTSVPLCGPVGVVALGALLVLAGSAAHRRSGAARGTRGDPQARPQER